MSKDSIVLHPIGIIHTPFTERPGTPIQGIFQPDAEGTVEVSEEFADGLKDIEGFSHIYLLYHLHRSEGYSLHCKPYRDDEERGVFACRAPKRPNHIGLSVVRLIERDYNILRIGEVDILDKSPLLDIKPYVPKFDARSGARTGWLEESDDRTIADDRF
ncbi:MAG: tRNA (N6-threonylcarbamoyladenosine(37)-N6)-methyltransferase TrmO [Armatimonadota bacterium]